MVNMNDVAKAAGVSKSTVSNVFSEKRAISKSAKERVLEVANQLNYKPNYMARSMVTKETKIIGLVTEKERIRFSQFNLSLFNGLIKECSEQGYRLLIDTLSQSHRQEVTNMTSEPIDGEILLDPTTIDQRVDERITSGRKLVVVGKPPAKYESVLPFVNHANVNIAETAASYLLDLGHRNILFINAVQKRTVSKDREKGYKQAFQNRGLPIRQELIIYRDKTTKSIDFGYQKTLEHVQEFSTVTAIITDTDQIALGVYRATAKLGKKIPEDISVFSFNNNLVDSSEFDPSLTSIHLDGEQMGKEAAKLLIEQLQAEVPPLKQVILQSSLVKRDSCTHLRDKQ